MIQVRMGKMGLGVNKVTEVSPAPPVRRVPRDRRVILESVDCRVYREFGGSQDLRGQRVMMVMMATPVLVDLRV